MPEIAQEGKQHTCCLGRASQLVQEHILALLRWQLLHYAYPCTPAVCTILQLAVCTPLDTCIADLVSSCAVAALCCAAGGAAAAVRAGKRRTIARQGSREKLLEGPASDEVMESRI